MPLVFRMDTKQYPQWHLVRYGVEILNGDSLREIPLDWEIDQEKEEDPEALAIRILQALIDGIKDHSGYGGSLVIPREAAIKEMNR